MESINLLEITNKKITRKGEEHRFFRIPSGMLIFPEKSHEETSNGLLKKIFKDGVKVISTLIIGMVTWFATREMMKKEDIIEPVKSPDAQIVTKPQEHNIPQESILDFVIVEEFLPIVASLVAVITIWMLLKKRKKD